MSDDPLSHPLAELGHISLHAQQLSQSTARLAAAAEPLAVSAGQLATGAGQVSRDLQHGVEVFSPILSELTGELKRLRLEIHDGARASSRSAWFLVVATAALVFATLVMAWPIWFPPAIHQPAPAASAPPAKAP